MQTPVLASLAALPFLAAIPAAAQVSLSGRHLPLELALEAAKEALGVCKANGYDVTATVVDVAGTPQVVLRADHATIHTKVGRHRRADRAGDRRDQRV